MCTALRRCGCVYRNQCHYVCFAYITRPAFYLHFTSDTNRRLNDGYMFVPCLIFRMFNELTTELLKSKILHAVWFSQQQKKKPVESFNMVLTKSREINCHLCASEQLFFLYGWSWSWIEVCPLPVDIIVVCIQWNSNLRQIIMAVNCTTFFWLL